MYKEKIVDAITGEESWRDYTAEEIAEVEAFNAELQKERLKAETAEAAKAAAKLAEKAALLTKLGITEDEAKLLLS
jgi:urease accessory protein UreE